MDDSSAAIEAPVAADDRHEFGVHSSAVTSPWQDAILAAALDCVIVSDHEGRILDFNPAAERTFGYVREAVLGKKMSEVIIPESLREAHEQGLRRYAETGQTAILGRRREFSARRADGTEFPVELTVVRVDVPGPPRFVGYLRDLTERKRVEQSLQLSLQIQSTINSLLEISLEPISLTEQLERTLDLLFSVPWIELESKGAIFLAEGTPPVLVMKAQRGLHDSLRATCARVPLGRCLCGRAASTRQIVFADCVDGRHETRYENMRGHGHYCVPIVSEGVLYGVLNLYLREGHQRRPEEEAFLASVAHLLAGVVRRRQAEEALRQSEERFQLAVRGSDAGIWDWDLRTNRVYFSPRWKAMLGYDRDEIGDGFAEWESRLHPDDRSRALAAVRDYLEGATGDYELEHRLRHKDGSYRWMLARAAAVRDSEGRPYRMAGSHLDVTARKQAEQKLRQREAELLAVERIQQHLLPQQSPRLPGFEVAGTTCPAEFAAGDYFDYLSFPDGSFGALVADVTGHDLSSALLTASTRAHIRSSAEVHNSVDDVVRRANSRLARETSDEHFVTLLLVQIDLQRRTLSYVNAGHPSGYLLDRAGEVKSVLKSESLPLGLLPDTEFPLVGPLRLETDDVVLLVSDGVLEARSDEGEFFGAGRAIQVVRDHRELAAAAIVDRLRDSIRDFTGQDRLADDVTAVVIKVK
jgi:PAS domain S-box-containing protein